MKGLNVKRIAAIGLGAALVGSVLAPAVMAATVNNLTSLKKSDIVNDSGVPVVDIIVGSQGKAPDVVWAGNIAAKVAQLAVSPVAGAGSDKAATVTIGGKTTMSGEGRETKIDLSVGPAWFDMTVDNGKTPSLIDDSDWEYDYFDETETMAVKETLDANVDLVLQDDPEGILAGQTVGSVTDEGMIGYTVSFDPALPEFTDGNDDIDLTIPLFGKTWEVKSVSPTKIVLGADELPTKVYVGDSVTVKGKGTYAGKDLTLTVTEVARSNLADTEFVTDLALYDGSTFIKSERGLGDGADVQDKFDSYVSTPISIDVVREGEGAKRYVDFQVGEGTKLTLEDGKEFGDDDNTKADKWVVTIDPSLEYITIANSADMTWDVADADSPDIQGPDSDAYRYGPMAEGTTVDIADQGMYLFKFEGMTTEAMYGAKIADATLTTVMDSQSRDVPMFFGPFREGAKKTIEIADRTFTVYVTRDGTTLKAWDGSSVDDAENDTADYDEITIDSGFDDTEQLELDLDYDTQDVIDYQVVSYNDGGDNTTYYLALDADQSTTLNVDVDNDTADIVFDGTWVDIDTNADIQVSYYMPTKLDDDILEKFVSGVETLEQEDMDNYAAVFTIDDGDGTAIKANVDTDSGNLIDSDTHYAGLTGTAVQAVIDSTIKLDSTDDKYLVATGTAYGTEVSVDDSELVWMIPDTVRKEVAYLGSSELTSETSGGTTFTDLKVGTPQTKDGITATATAITGGATTGYTVNKVGNIVKLDTATPNGKSIIVGGYLVNTQATNLMIDGVSIQERLQNSGDWVAAVLPEGKIVVAGWTAEDTGSAAAQLISALEGFM